MDPISEAKTVCPRCASALEPGWTRCPRCGLATERGIVVLDPGAEVDAASQNALDEEVAYETKTVTCLPMDLERVARAEAVDGWMLIETTVHPAAAGQILAAFRRPARAVAAKAPAEPGRPARQQRRSAPTPEPAARRGTGAPRPALGPEPDALAALGRIIPLVVTGIVILFLADKLGVAGLILGLIFVPGIVRSILGGQRRGKP